MKVALFASTMSEILLILKSRTSTEKNHGYIKQWAYVGNIAIVGFKDNITRVNSIDYITYI